MPVPLFTLFSRGTMIPYDVKEKKYIGFWVDVCCAKRAMYLSYTEPTRSRSQHATVLILLHTAYDSESSTWFMALSVSFAERRLTAQSHGTRTVLTARVSHSFDCNKPNHPPNFFVIKSSADLQITVIVHNAIYIKTSCTEPLKTSTQIKVIK